MRILVVNAGSSSLKLRVLGADDETLIERETEWRGDAPFPEASLDDLPPVDAVGHRVVHGGDAFSAATWIDGDVRERLEELTTLAPLHQPRSLAAIDATARALSDVRAAACFDTAFHVTMPPAASTYALPPKWRGLRRYGFHGLSHSYVSRRAAELVGRPANELRVVSCHLGAGASLAAVAHGRSVDTTMGFTPLEGLVMATRAGSVDPGLLLWLLRDGGLDVDELADALEHRSGLTGLAGTGDMREVLARSRSGDADARLALDVFVHRLRTGIGAMVAAIGGIDVLAFTGGIGEHAPEVRAAAAAGLGFIGVQLDPERNAGAHGDAEIGAAGVRVLVITAREDREIARQVRALGD